jgi:hypothetical protein
LIQIIVPVGDDKVPSGEIRIDRCVKEAFFKNELDVKINVIKDTTDWEADLVEIFVKVKMPL